MKHKTHPKSMHVRLLTIFFACTFLVSGMSITVAADTENENIVFNYGFSSGETHDKEIVEISQKTENGNVEFLKLTAEGDGITLKPVLEQNTNYTFSFDLRNSKADALMMYKEDNYFCFKDTDKTIESIIGTAYNYLREGGNFSYIIPEDYKFGAERSGEEVEQWRKVSINFTTPFQHGTTASKVYLTLTSAVDDDFLAIDNVTLEKTGNAPNRIFNGDLEAYDASKGVKILTNFAPSSKPTDYPLSDTSVYELVYDEETDNHFLKVTNTGRKNAFGLRAYGSFIARLDNELGNKSDYKISVKYKQPKIEKNSNAPRFRLGTGNANLDSISHGKLPELEETLTDTWFTYNVYLNGTDFLGYSKAESWMGDAYFGYQVNSYCMDDLYLGFDETGIDFHERLDFFYEDGEAKTDRYFNSADNAVPADMLMSERSIPASSLVKLEDADKDGFVNVTPRLHYVPTKNADETYDVQDISFIAAVYQKVGDKKILYSMDVATGKTTADGKTIDIKIDDVEVPAEDGYYIEAMAWDGTNSMKPVKGVDKTIFN